MQRCHKYKINCGVKISKEHCRYFTQKKKWWMSTKKNYCENAKTKESRGRRGGYQLGCVQRIEVGWGGGGGGGLLGRADVNKELKFL